MVYGSVNLATGHQNLAEIVVRHPGTRVASQRFTVKGFAVAVETALAVGPVGERRQEHGHQKPSASAPPRRTPGQKHGDPGCRRGDRAEACRWLEGLRDIGETEWIDIEETQDWKQRADEEQPAGQRASGSPANEPERRGHRQQPAKVSVPSRGLYLHVPARIGEHEAGWPKELAQVEPDHVGGQQNAMSSRNLERGSLGAYQFALDPDGENPGGDGR